MSAAVSDGLPYGVRDLKLTQYIDAAGTVLGSTSVDLPVIQTLNFTEAEEFAELRGDDKLITTRGKGSQVNWDLEAGGLAVKPWCVFSGGSVIERGLTPNRVIEIQKRSTASRPWFRIDGRMISDSGGDILVRIYRCRATGDIGSNFTDGEFATTTVSGVGAPLLDDTNDLIYSIFRRETASALSLTPDPNPVQSPLNLTATTKSGTSPNITQNLTWTPVAGATVYGIELSTDSGDTWGDATPSTSNVANVAVTGLSTGTVLFRVTATVGGVVSDPCPPITVVLT